MFRVRYMGNSNWYIADGHSYLHSDGRVFNTREYFPTEEIAQAVLDKFYPKPQHVWEHGDVVKCYDDTIVICVNIKGKLRIFGLGYPRFNETEEYSVSVNLDGEAVFLFNIKEKI